MTRYGRAPDVLWRRSLGRLIARPRGGVPVMIDGTGAALWDALAEPGSIVDVARTLATAFDADAALVARDVEPVLEELVEQALVSIVP